LITMYKAQTLNGDWVFGDYSMKVSKAGISHLITNENTQYEIDKDTLCRNTGYCDTEGNEIYEKDLVGHIRNHLVSRIGWDDASQQFKLFYQHSKCTGDLKGDLTIIGSASSQS